MSKYAPESERPQRQRGLSRLRLVLLLALLAALGSAGWWWTQRAAGSSAAAAGGAAGAASSAASASGAASAGPGGRRFAGPGRVQPVSVAAARQQDVRVILAAIGNISALNTATVRARVEGELKAIRFTEGQQVKAGALLAEIDPRSYEIQLAQVQGQLTRDQALLLNAQLDLERYKDLAAKDSIAKQQVDTQQALVRQLVGTVQSDQAQVDNAKLQLSYTKITAPISGRLGLKQADLGNIIRATDSAGLVSITQTQPISVVFAVPEANLPQIARKLKGPTALTVEAWDREQRKRLATGRVSTTDNAIDPVTGTIKLKAEFANADGSLFPNQFVNIRLQVDTLEGALAVPATAVQRGAQGTFVYVVKADSSVTIRRIRTGTTEGDWVSVQGELAAGERVVTDGADRLREGAKVEVITPAPRPSGQGAAASQPPGPDDSARPARTAGPPPAAALPQPGTPASRAPAGKPQVVEAPAPVSAAPSGASWIDQLPPEAQERARAAMQRLPPDAAERVGKMSPDERRAFFRQLRERREQ